MRIAYVCAYSKIAKGGDSRVAWELARHMAEKSGHDVWMVCPGSEYSIQRDSAIPDLNIQTVPAVDITEGVSMFSPGYFNVVALYQILDNLKPDVVHSHSIDPLSYAFQGWALTRQRPFVYTGHLLATKTADWQSFNLGKALETVIGVSLSAYTKNFYKNCNKIICLNNYAKDDFAKVISDQNQLIIIPNGYDLPESNNIANLREAKEYNLLFAGYLNERKNQAFLIDMLNYLNVDKPVNLYLAGTFMSGKYKKILKSKISKLPENIKVHLLGYVDHEDLMNMYSNIHYVVSAALAEVQSLAIIESLGTGTPVIGLKNTTTEELIKNGYNGELLNQDISEKNFAKCVSKYLAKENHDYKLICKNSIKSVEFLDYSKIIKQTESLYSSLLTKNSKIVKRDRVFRMLGKTFKWDIPNLKVNGKKLNYKIAQGLISTVVVSGVGLISVFKGIKSHLTGKDSD